MRLLKLRTPVIALAALTLTNIVFAVLDFHVGFALAISYAALLLLTTDCWREKIKLALKAHNDSLTGLSNRACFYQDLYDRIDKAAVRSDCVHVFMMDLNHFKQVNDTLGHDAGDELLKEVSKRIKAALRDNDKVYRLGGDEFAVIIGDTNCDTATSVGLTKVIAERILDSFKSSIQLGTNFVDSGISIGIATFPTHGTSGQDVVKCADVAMYIAKQEKCGLFLYSKDKDPNSIEYLTLPSDIRKAIENKEFELFFQPKKRLSDNKVVGVEALLRWNHPKYGRVSPDKFIPIAEKTGFIIEITEWIIVECAIQSKYWESLGYDLNVSINVAANSISNSNLVINIANAIVDRDIDATKLTLEVTETSIISDPATAIKMLVLLSSIGINISIDDFGTGHASFLYIKHLPITEIKIDKSFVHDVHKPQDRSIVKSALDLAHNIGCTVVAEGVETKDTEDILRGMGCDIVQGYYIARPMSASDFAEWFKQNGGFHD